MRKIWLIIQREYLTRVRKRSFVIMTILGPVGFALFFVFAILVAGQEETKKRIAVINDSGYELSIKDTTSLYFFKEDTSLAYMELVYQNLEYDGILYIPPIKSITRPADIEYRSASQIGINAISHIEKQLTHEMMELKIKEANIDKQVLDDLNNTDVKVETITLGEEGETKVDAAVSAIMGYIMGFLIYMVLFIYGNMVMKGVMEEKTNRIVEIIISSVKPIQLMLGKIIGVGAVGITQFVLWGILVSITQVVLSLIFHTELAELQTVMNDPKMVQGAGQQEMVDAIQVLSRYNWWAILGYFIYFFFGGYLLYGALFAAVGAAANEQDDMQAMNVIISIPIIISIFIMMKVVQDPNTPLAVFASIFPLTSPIVMMARIPFNPEPWQIVASMVMLIAGFAFTTWLAAKIYRVGILMYGKKVTFKEIAKWVFYK